MNNFNMAWLFENKGTSEKNVVLKTSSLDGKHSEGGAKDWQYCSRQ